MGQISKTLLVLSGGQEAIEGITVAKEMGLRVIICDGNVNAPANYIGDDFIHASIYDPEEVLEAVAAYRDKDKINGVITIASDAVRSVARVAEYLKLPSPGMEQAVLSTDKYKMKKCFKEEGLPIGGFTDINSEEELKNKIKYFKESVLKPIDSRGARGVVRVNKDSDLSWAYEYSKQFSKLGKLILEEWLSGQQISTESLVLNGKTYLCGVADRNYSMLDKTYPFVVENGGETPSKYYSKIKSKLNNILDAAAKAIGIRNGVLKGDIVIKNGQPYIIEVAIRLSGGFFSTITIPLVYGINLVKAAISISLAEEVSPPKQLQHKVYQSNRFLFVDSGVVKSINCPKRDTLPDWVKYYDVNLKVGEKIFNIENHTMRKGTVLVCGKTRQQAVSRANRIINLIKVKMK
ncbi:MAG: ATP-grasp domain-containing protein [bacterium]